MVVYNKITWIMSQKLQMNSTNNKKNHTSKAQSSCSSVIFIIGWLWSWWYHLNSWELSCHYQHCYQDYQDCYHYFYFFTQISAWYISDNIFDIPSTTLCRPCEVSCNTGLTCIVGSFLVLRLQLRSRLPSRTNTKIPGGDQGKKRRPTPFADTPTCR